MATAVAVAVGTTRISGKYPKWTLMSNGQIVPSDGAGLPVKSSSDGGPNWDSPRFNSVLTPTTGFPSGEIAVDLKFYNTTNPADPLGYMLDRWGRLTPVGTNVPLLAPTETWGPAFFSNGMGNNEARALSLKSDGSGGFVLRKTGQMYRFGGVTVPMVTFTTWAPFDYARDLVLEYVSGTVIHGYVLGASGELAKCSTSGVDAFLSLTSGSVNYGGYDIMRALVFNFTTHVGYAMDGFGTPFVVGGSFNYPPGGPTTQKLAGGPYYPADVFVDFAWPVVSSPVFVSLTNQGLATEWDQFVKPTWTFTTPADPLTNTSRLILSGVYGPSGGSPPVAALSQLTAFLYPLAVTQQAGFKPNQGTGHVPGYSHAPQGLTGYDGGDTYSVTFANDLADNTEYVAYVKVKSLDGETSGWVSRAFNTAFSRPATPTLVATGQPNDALGARVQLVASGGLSGGQVYNYEFSDDGGTTWYSVFGANATTATTVYHYEVAFLKNQRFRVKRITTSPYLESLPSTTQIINLAVPTAGADWRFVPLTGATPVVLDAAEWSKKLRHPHSIEDPAGETEAAFLSGGYKGIQGTLRVNLMSKAAHDALVALLETPQVLLLQSPMSEQWYVMVGEADLDFWLLGKDAGEPYPVGFRYKGMLPVTQVKRPIVV